MKKKNLSLLLAMAMTVTTAMTGLTVNVHAEAIDESTSDTVEQAEVAAVPEVKTEEPVAADSVQGTLKDGTTFEPTKVRIIKEADFLEIYWDREVKDSDVLASYELKNGDNVLTISNPGIASMYFYNEGQGFTSFQYKGEIDESKPITLEIKGEIKDGTEGSTATAVKKIYNVTYENYYTRFYTTKCGILCESSDDVAESSLKAAGDMIDIMLAKTDTGITAELVKNNAKMALYGPHENAYFIPEHRNAWNPGMYYVEGYGGSFYNNGVSSIAERNVIRSLTGSVTTAYKNENILVHEFGHSVKTMGMDAMQDKTLKNEFSALYKSRMRAGMWPNTYAASNPDEYFATMCAIWFNVMSEKPDWTDGVRCPVNTRAELKEYDPETYAFFEKIFPSDLTLAAPWDSVPDDYKNPEGGGIVPPAKPEEGNHNYATDEYKMKLFSTNGNKYLITRDEDNPYLWWNYSWDSRAEQSTGGSYPIDDTNVWKVNRTEDGYYQMIAVDATYKDKALAEAADGSIVYIPADLADKAQLWTYEAVESSSGIFVNASTGHVIGLAKDAGDGTYLKAVERANVVEDAWVLQNLTTGTQLFPRKMHDFENTYFSIISTEDGASRIEGFNGVCVWNTGDSLRNSWKIVPAGDGYFYIESGENPGQVLAPSENGTTAGSVILPEEKDKEDATQLWKIEIVNGEIRFLNKESDLALGVKDGKVENGASLVLVDSVQTQDAAAAAPAGQLWAVTNKTTGESLVPADIPNVVAQNIEPDPEPSLDYTAADAAAAKAGTVDRTKYTADSLKALDEAAKNYKDAKEAGTIKDQDELDALTKAMTDAYDALEEIKQPGETLDFTEAEKLVELANDVDRSKYTSDSLKVLDEAVNAYKSEKANVKTQAEIDELAAAMQSALNGLVKLDDKKEHVHEWNTEYTVDKAPTCTEKGTESIHCKTCDATKDSREIAALGHTWDSGTVTKKPTATKEGVRTYTCKVCKETRTETIAKTSTSTGTTTTKKNNTTTTTKSGTGVKTGDESNLTMWFALAAVCGLAGAGLTVTRRKRQ